MSEERPAVCVVFGPLSGPKFRVGRTIGSGSYGELRLGKNLVTNEYVAVKLEKRNTRDPQLMSEWSIYQTLGCNSEEGVPGFPRAFYFGPVDLGKNLYNGLVIDLLCVDMEMIFETICNRQFSLKTVLMIALQMLSRIEYFHSKNLVYVDIKPENFLIGNEGTSSENIIHLVDYGLAKSYIDSRTKKHIPYREGVYPSGTLRYLSVNSHCAIEQTRRDDMESLGYLFAYFLRGKLPWSGLKVKTEDERFSKVGQIKKKTPPEMLCKGLPDEFANYIKAVKKLKFDEKPNYIALKKMFEDLMARKGYINDGRFDWAGKLDEYARKDSEAGRET